jgi:hypothetical protein
MWCAFTGNYPDGTYRNIYLPSGQLCQHTWRTWGQIIADARGHKKESYLTFWESHVSETKIKSVERKFKKAGWKFADDSVCFSTNEKLRDETISQISDGKETPKIKEAKKILKATVGSIKPKKRGRPPKVK